MKKLNKKYLYILYTAEVECMVFFIIIESENVIECDLISITYACVDICI